MNKQKTAKAVIELFNYHSPKTYKKAVNHLFTTWISSDSINNTTGEERGEMVFMCSNLKTFFKQMEKNEKQRA